MSQISLRTASDKEHAEIEKQHMGRAKTLVITMVFMIFLFVVAGVQIAEEMRIRGLSDTVIAIIGVLFVVAVVANGFAMAWSCRLLLRIANRQYVIADGIITEKEKKSYRGGIVYWATVTFADGSKQRVKIVTKQIYEGAETGKPAVVIYLTDRNGEPGKNAYSLSIVYGMSEGML